MISPDKRYFNFTGNHGKLSELQCGSQELVIVSLSLRIIVPFFYWGKLYALISLKSTPWTIPPRNVASRSRARSCIIFMQNIKTIRSFFFGFVTHSRQWIVPFNFCRFLGAAMFSLVFWLCMRCTATIRFQNFR